jgi:hypothetical protein
LHNVFIAHLGLLATCTAFTLLALARPYLVSLLRRWLLHIIIIA